MSTHRVITARTYQGKCYACKKPVKKGTRYRRIVLFVTDEQAKRLRIKKLHDRSSRAAFLYHDECWVDDEEGEA